MTGSLITMIILYMVREVKIIKLINLKTLNYGNNIIACIHVHANDHEEANNISMPII